MPLGSTGMCLFFRAMAKCNLCEIHDCKAACILLALHFLHFNLFLGKLSTPSLFKFFEVIEFVEAMPELGYSHFASNHSINWTTYSLQNQQDCSSDAWKDCSFAYHSTKSLLRQLRFGLHWHLNWKLTEYWLQPEAVKALSCWVCFQWAYLMGKDHFEFDKLESSMAGFLNYRSQ